MREKNDSLPCVRPDSQGRTGTRSSCRLLLYQQQTGVSIAIWSESRAGIQVAYAGGVLLPASTYVLSICHMAI